MVTSMTGFGRGMAEQENFRITVEMKSVNHRFLECFIRMPRQLSQIEDKIKKKIGHYIKRGKVDVFVTISGEGLISKSLKVDWQLIDSYYDFAKEAKKRYHINQDITLDHLLANSEILTVEETEGNNDELQDLIHDALEQAAVKLHYMRKNEGLELEKDLIYHLQSFKHILSQSNQVSPTIVTKYRERLEKRIKDFADGQIDESRILTEVAVFAEKADVTEELTRLDSHLAQFELALKKDEPIGRRLDFLTQEMNREVNTIGSKGNDANLVSYVVEMKSIIEKIREQVQNIE
ncbi:YicC/YloC family endoribonuclease [Jeotgalibacillus marinus]|uniref:YicC/YloC family endoribonuclease n=1 Tax=Jeotgalibacillus marinus TaxID=86667 RepID=A0ABV3Q206_9BACL